MIGQSRLAWVGIHAGIAFFRAITPLSLLYCAARLFWLRDLPPPFIALDVYAAAESAFYFCVYLPRRSILRRPANHPPILSRNERRQFFQKCVATIPNIHHFALLWSPAKPSEIKRENVKDWLCWAVFSRRTWTPEEDDELEGYISEAERLFDVSICKGRGDAKALCLTLDSFNALHRPLFLYIFGVGGADLITQVYARCHGFLYFRRPNISSIFATLPLSPLSLCTTQVSPAKNLSYYYRAHTSKKRLPVLFIHGIGIGLYTYVQFMKEFIAASDNPDASNDGQVGFIALEILPISFRITHPALSQDAMCHEILQILQKHQWNRFVLVGQSYGTVISTHLLHNPSVAPMIGPVFLIDPVTFLLHLPDVVYNFMRRPPRYANEWMHYYFANTDLDVAHTLARRFFWTENIIWKEELSGKRVTAVLGDKDIIVDTDEVGKYLTRDEGVTAMTDKRDDAWKGKEWTGTGLEVLWLENCEHAQAFYKPKQRRKLVEVLLEYCDGTDEAS